MDYITKKLVSHTFLYRKATHSEVLITPERIGYPHSKYYGKYTVSEFGNTHKVTPFETFEKAQAYADAIS